MRIVVTGADGFVGRHLLPILRDAGHEVTGWQLSRPGDSIHGARGVDLTDEDQLAQAMAQDLPDRIVHLAAFSDVGASVRSPGQVWKVNVLATVNLVGVLARQRPDCALVFASSGDSYGATFNEHRPVVEHHPLQPLNPYSASKAAAEVALGQYKRSSGLAVIIVRSFNCAGPGQRTGFVVSDFACQVARIEDGQQPPRLEVGNLSASRDFIDVRDAADAYARLAGLPRDAFEGQALNLCSGTSRPVRAVVDRLIELSGLQIELATDPSRLRPSDVPIALGDPGALQSLTGWKPARRFDQTLIDTLDDWRLRVATGA